MGKFEVLEYLSVLRLTGDHEYRKYVEVHAELRRRGVSLSYASVWRTMNCLYGDGLLEVDFEIDGLQRSARFRARSPSVLHSSQMKRVDNILQADDEKGRRGSAGEARGRFAAAGGLARG